MQPDFSRDARIAPILTRIAQLPKKPRLLVTIDGPCGSGKSTLADALSDALNAPIIRMDDFFLPDAPITILEGSYSMLPDIRRHADLTLFLRINPEVQQKRLLQRVGAERLKDFNARWIPLENAYFDAYHLPDESCVLVPQDVNAPVRP